MFALATTLAAFNLSANSLISALLVLVIAVILFVAVWRLVAPLLGQFSNIVFAICVIILILVIAGIFGII